MINFNFYCDSNTQLKYKVNANVGNYYDRSGISRHMQSLTTNVQWIVVSTDHLALRLYIN